MQGASDGSRTHGKGCYEVSEEGGGVDYPEIDADIQLISDALKLRCSKCDGMHLTVKNEEPIRNVPGIGDMPCISYVCRDCGFDSAKVEKLKIEVE